MHSYLDKLNDKNFTFWLLTIKVDNHTRAYKGEGSTDAEALDIIRAAYAKDTDKLHHAPLCPANHYCGQRPPIGSCSCGAVELGTINAE